LALGQLQNFGEVGEVWEVSLSEAGKSFRLNFLRVPKRGPWNLVELILGREVVEQMP